MDVLESVLLKRTKTMTCDDECAATSQVQAIQSSNEDQSTATLWAAALTSMTVKKATALAYAQKRRSLVASDVLNYIGEAFELVTK